MKKLHMLTFILLVAGGLNWLLVGAFDYDLVYSILGDSLAKVVYILVGVSAIVEVATHKSNCKACGSGSMM